MGKVREEKEWESHDGYFGDERVALQLEGRFLSRGWGGGTRA